MMVGRVAEEDKHRMEKEALDEICSTLGDSASATEIRELWNEYEAGATEEAKMVKVRVLYKDIQTDRSGGSATVGTERELVLCIQDIDKFEMILQADDYERDANLIRSYRLKRIECSSKKERRTIFIGPPGCGKGTQSPLVKDEYCLCHLATGDILRAAVSAGTEMGKKAKAAMES
ncbi:hypothetical protein BBJ28_00024751, partial [Nothophytophthora sp. Chile5]